MARVHEDFIIQKTDLIHLCAKGIETDSVEDLALKRGGQVDFGFDLGEFRLRAQAYLSRKGLSIALRPNPSQIRTLDELKMPSIIKEIIKKPTGLILVAGATGSGKSTTMAAIIKQLNETVDGHIITLEDPIEFVHKDIKCRIQQRTVGLEKDVESFEKGVVAAMRQDPDVILVGEMRDYGTVSAALSAAQTGHLVLGTVHANSAVQTIERILSFFSEKEALSSRGVLSAVLSAVICQQLLRSKDGVRNLALEIMLATDAIRSGIANAQAKESMTVLWQEIRNGSSSGHITMNDSLVHLVRANSITKEEAMLANNDPHIQTLENKLKSVTR